MTSVFFPLANYSTLFMPVSIMSPDQKDIRGHPDHHSGYGDHRRLWCVWVFPPQPIHRVGQVHRVWDISQQTKHCQETGQPTGDRAILLHGEWRFGKKRVLLVISKGQLPRGILLLLLKYISYLLCLVNFNLSIPTFRNSRFVMSDCIPF